MGCDIHSVFQARKNGEWVDVPSTFQDNRHYQLFAVLAGVRNGYGFAGIPTGDAVTPISEPRGLPDDFGGDPHRMTKEAWEAYHLAKYYQPGDEGYGELWMGDHAHSWLTSDEILAYAEKAPIVGRTGVVSREEFAAWDHKGAPESWSGGITGRGISVVDQKDVERDPTIRGTHVRIYWHEGLRSTLAYFFEEVARLHAEHGGVRFVFGFDS